MDFLPYLLIGLFFLLIFGWKLFLLFKPKGPGKRRGNLDYMHEVAENMSGHSSSNVTQEYNQKLPYRTRPSLLTPSERNFYEALRPLVSEHWRLFSKVRMEDILEVTPGLEPKEAYGFRSRIKSRHIDFVLCDKESLEVLMCIELDDRSHQRKDRKEVDAFKDQAMRDAGLTLTRVPVQSSYSEEYLRNLLFEETSTSAKATEPANAEDPHARYRASFTANQ